MKTRFPASRRIGALLALSLGLATIGGFGPVQARSLAPQAQAPQLTPKVNCGPDGTRICRNGVCYCV